jgi:hypothetical protein
MDSDENLLASHGCNDAYQLRGQRTEKGSPGEL